MEPAGFQLLYEQGPCLVVVKPAGVLTQAPPQVDSLEVRIKRYLEQRDQTSGPAYLGVPHRLDRPVSGVMVFGTNQRATRRLADQFQQRRIDKVYWGLVAGTVEPDAGTWTDYLWKVPGHPRAEVVSADHPEARLAVLHYRVRERLADATLLEMQLETGRTHQIRIQAASRAHPILGDELYGSDRPFGPTVDDQRERRIALHGHTLAFQHPSLRLLVRAVAAFPADWQSLGLRAVQGDSVVTVEEMVFPGRR